MTNNNLVEQRARIHDQISSVVFSDESCADPACDNCQATVDALTDRVVMLVYRPTAT